MTQSTNQTASQPMIVKYVQATHNGIQSHTFSRYAIGYVLRGTKYVYYGDKRHRLVRGDVFYLGVGTHYTEDIPDGTQPFEQIVFYYTPAELQRILMHLNMTYGLKVTNEHQCDECASRSHVGMPAWGALRSFFATANSYVRDNLFQHDEAAENIKMTELIYLIASHEDCCLKSKLLSNIDSAKEFFEQVIYANVFRDISIEQLASMSNRSLTSFKKEFRRLFNMPPHKWFIRQRLVHARLLLISTTMSISEIGIECSFPNTSHFIKLFKKAFDTTPATYRSRYMHHTLQDPAPAAEEATRAAL